MDYISSKTRNKLMNEPYILSSSELDEMIQQNEFDIAETKHVTETSNHGETYYSDDGNPGNEKINNNRLAFYKEILYRDAKTDGFIMEYPHGTVISQGAHNSYYRGENQIYISSQPSLYRSLDKLNTTEKIIYHFVANMRIAEFQLFLNKLKIVKFWSENYGTVLYEPLAQHYGLETEWLDITSDLNVALFFATCKYDKINKKWAPLKKREIESNKNTQYGVIFHIPKWKADFTQINAGYMKDDKANLILPIGYQPFMRCHSQHAYGICMKKPFPLQEDYSFEKLHFKHDERFAEKIFEKMDCGRKIYPQEGLAQFDDIIEKIKETTTFSIDAYKIALKKCKLSETEIQKMLKQCDCKNIFGANIEINNEEVIKVSRQRIRACNRRYKDFSIEKKYGIILSTRISC